MKSASHQIDEVFRETGFANRLNPSRLTWCDAPSAGSHLVRVMNKRQEFLWVHPQFEKEY